MRHTLRILAAGLLSFATMKAGAQGMAVNSTGATADPSAIIDASSTSQGMLIPRMSNAQMTGINGGSPATGLLVYCTNCSPIGFWYYPSGGPWTSLSAPANTTTQGNTFNGASELVQLNASTQLPAVSGTNLTNLDASNLSSGTVNEARLGGNWSSINQTNLFLRGDNNWENAVQNVSSGTLTTGTTPFTDTLFHTTVITPSTNASIFYTLNNAAPYSVWTNSTNAAALPVYGKVMPQALATPNGGTASSSTFYRGDGSWQTISSGGNSYCLGGAEYLTENKASYFTGITIDNSGSTLAVGDVGFPIPITGTLKAIVVSGECTATYVSGSTNIVTYTIYQNGSATSTTGTLTFSNSATVGQRFSNVTTTSLSVTAGDILAIDISQSNYTNGAIGRTSVVLYFN